jgi:hypothetical protein
MDLNTSTYEAALEINQDVVAAPVKSDKSNSTAKSYEFTLAPGSVTAIMDGRSAYEAVYGAA